VIAVFDVLLRIVPCAATSGHGDCDEEAGDDHAEQHRTYRGEGICLRRDGIDDEVQHDRAENRQHGRDDHFLDRVLGQHIDAAAVFRFARAFHDTRNFLELTAHFDDDSRTGATNSGHAHGTEQVRQKTAEQQTDHDIRVGQAEVDLDVREEPLKVRRVSREQHQRAQTGRTDRVALGNGFRRVADSVQGVRGVPDALIHFCHFRNAARIVRHRTVSVERNDHTGKRQHRGYRDGNSEQTSDHVGHDDRDTDHNRRNGRGFHGDSKALNNVRAVAGFRCLSNRLNRTEAGRRVVFRHPNQQSRQHQPDDPTEEEIRARKRRVANSHLGIHADRHFRDRIEQNGRDDRGAEEALVERAHDVVAATETHKVRTDDGGNQANTADGHRVDQEFRHRDAGDTVDQRQHHGGTNGHDIGFEEVCRHTGTVANVVANVVGDHARVAGIIFRNTGFDFTNQVGTNVGTFGEDPAAETREDRNQRGTESKTDKAVDDLLGLVRVVDVVLSTKDQVVNRDRQQCEARNQHPGNGTCLEGNVQAFSQAFRGGLGRTNVGAHGDIHPNVPCGTGQNCANHEANRAGPAKRQAQDDCNGNADEPDCRVLTVQVRGCAFLYGARNFLHAFRTGTHAKDALGRDRTVHNGGDSASNDQVFHGSLIPFIPARPIPLSSVFRRSARSSLTL